MIANLRPGGRDIMENKTFRLKCPYCGITSKYMVPLTDGWPKNILCDVEAGGCDRFFAVSIVTRYSVTYYTLNEIDPAQAVSK
jgi:hypothetical protein